MLKLSFYIQENYIDILVHMTLAYRSGSQDFYTAFGFHFIHLSALPYHHHYLTRMLRSGSQWHQASPDPPLPRVHLPWVHLPWVPLPWVHILISTWVPILIKLRAVRHSCIQHREYYPLSKIWAYWPLPIFHSRLSYIFYIIHVYSYHHSHHYHHHYHQFITSQSISTQH